MFELELEDVFAQIKSRKSSAAIIFGIPLVICCLYLWLVNPIYEAGVTVAETSSPFNFSRPSILGGGTDPFSMFGFGVEDGSVSYQNYLFLMTSDSVASRVFEDEHILAKVYGDRWNGQKKKWQESSSFANSIINFIKRALGQRIIIEKDASDFGLYLRDNVSSTRLANRALHRISFQHEDKEFALYLINILLRETEALYRERLLDEAQHIEAFIEEEMRRESNVEMIRKLSEISEQYLYKRISTKTPRSVIVEWVDDPGVINKPVKPKLALTIIFATSAGILLVLMMGLILCIKNLSPAPK